MSIHSNPGDLSALPQIVAMPIAVPSTCLADDVPGNADWLDTMLTKDARHPVEDPTFVAQVVDRLAQQPTEPQPDEEFCVTHWSPRLLMGFVTIVATTLWLTAPSALQAWLQMTQHPWTASPWVEPDLWGFMLGVSMLTLGGLELVRTLEAQK
jgi:CheY-like chemotaxis protein